MRNARQGVAQETRDRNDTSRRPPFLRCRLCRHVGIAVFLSILILEGVILFYFVHNVERERLAELEKTNFALAQSLFVDVTPGAGYRGLLQDAALLAKASDIRGGALYTNANRLVGVFGETPETRLYEAVPGKGGRFMTNETRYETVWRFGMADPSLIMVARLDATEVRAEVDSLFWRIMILVVVISVFVTAVTMLILGRLTLGPILALRESLLGTGASPSNPARHKLQPQREDELGEVFRAFNHMVDRLEASNRRVRSREEALNQLKTDLERMVDERTASLLAANEKLRAEIVERRQAEEGRRRALAEAERANQAKTEFLATMSHELRTPLNAIMGFSDVLRYEYLGTLGDEKYQEYANDIHDSSSHLLALVNDILDLSAIESGAHVIERSPVDLKAVVDDCARTIRESATENGIDFKIEVPDALPPLHASRRGIKQILLNLLHNAVKFTAPGGRITVSVTASESGVVLQVGDTGIGIEKHRLPTLTEPFVKASDDPMITDKGTGLGLAIVRSLVEMHDGGMAIESTVGKGTTITVTLPNGRP